MNNRQPSLAIEVTCTQHGPMTRIQGGWRCPVAWCRYVDDGFLAGLFVPAPPGVSISVTLVREDDR